MTNDNKIRTKANAVFFSAIMVLSVMAIGFAAAPVAAANNPTVGTFSNTSPNGGTTVTHDVEFTVEDVSDDGGTDTFQVFLPPEGEIVSLNSFSVENSSGDSISVTGSPSLSDDNGGINNAVSFDISPDTSASAQDVTVSLSADVAWDNTATSDDVDLSVSDSGNSDISRTSTGTTITISSSSNADLNRITHSNGDTLVTSGNDVFQGEEAITFGDTSSDSISASSLSGTSGNREGTPLQMPIPTDQETGTYDLNGPTTGDGGFSTTVVQPRITTSEVQLNGDDVSQIGDDNAGNIDIAAQWNFYEAEDLDLTVEDPSGADITNEVLSTGDRTISSTTGNEETVPLDLQGEDAGSYTVIFEGNDDLDQEEVVEEYTIELTNQDTLSLETDTDSVTRGDNLDYTISGGTNGNFHLVAIENDDFRSNLEDGDSVFRNVQDTTEVGYANDTGSTLTSGVSPNEADYAYAIVEIDGTQGAGSIETASLDDTSVDIDVYSPNPAAGSETFYDVNQSGIQSEDDTDFDVNEGEVALNNPTDSYTVGAEVDINGTAQSADNVAIYARDNSDWEQLDINDDGNTNNNDYISVDSDDTFEEEDVRLSTASDIYSFEGQYDIGVVDVADLGEYSEPSTLDTSQFSSASSARYTLDVQPGDLTANFETINGQIADDVDDEITVNGTAAGQDQVVIAFVGQRGDTVTTTATVDSDDTFEEDDISLSDISQGSVSGHVISPGRDGEYGDGFATDAGTAANRIDGFGDGSSSGDQIRSQIVANTVDDTGSDDLIVNTNFRLNDPTLSIDNVYAEGAEASGLNPVATGETVVIEGTTNRQSDNAAITFEMLTQDDESVASTSTDEWGNDGQFSVTIDTSNLDIETGTYIVEADDGESTDRVNVEIVEEREDTSTATPAPDDGTATPAPDTETATPEPDTETATPEPDTETATEEPTSTPTSTPGFGVVVALAALLAAALLAVRRND